MEGRRFDTLGHEKGYVERIQRVGDDGPSKDVGKEASVGYGAGWNVKAHGNCEYVE